MDIDICIPIRTFLSYDFGIRFFYIGKSRKTEITNELWSETDKLLNIFKNNNKWQASDGSTDGKWSPS